VSATPQQSISESSKKEEVVRGARRERGALDEDKERHDALGDLVDK